MEVETLTGRARELRRLLEEVGTILKLLGIYSIAAVAFSAPCFAIAKYDRSAYIIMIASLLLLAAVYGLFALQKDAFIISIVFCYVLNIVVIPLLSTTTFIIIHL